MTLADVDALSNQILCAGFAVAVALGWITRRANFCTMGAISDIVTMGDSTRLRTWALAAGIGMLAFWALAAGGAIDPLHSVYASQRWIWLSALSGGALFGFGMALASGCPNRALLLLGGGNLKALGVLLVVGVVAWSSISGLLADVRILTVNQVSVETHTVNSLLPSWLALALGLDIGPAGLGLAGLIGSGLLLWALQSKDFRASRDALQCGLGLGLLLAAIWWINGHLAFVSEHPQTLEPAYLGSGGGRYDALSFVAPVATTLQWLLGSKPLSMGVVLVAGLIGGAVLQALQSRTFHWQGFRDRRDLALHVAGAACMGFGGVTAGGCTIGHGLSGLSTLNLVSLVALSGMVLGCVGGLRLQVWLVMRQT